MIGPTLYGRLYDDGHLLGDCRELAELGVLGGASLEVPMRQHTGSSFGIVSGAQVLKPQVLGPDVDYGIA